MIAYNIPGDALSYALAQVNKRFSDNIIWNRPPEPLNRKGRTFRFTLRCVSSAAPGHRRSIPHYNIPARRMVSACWHVHGTFFDALLEHTPEAAIHTTQGVIRDGEGNWRDYNIGSVIYPVNASEACDCA